MAVQRVLRNTQATLEVTFYASGVATDADGAVTVDITRGDGSSFASGSATTKPPATTGIYRYTLAPQTNLEYFTVVWNGTFTAVAQKVTTHAEVVGAYYVATADLRATDGLTSATNYPQAKLEEARQWFEDLAETFCAVAFVPRYRRDLLNGASEDWLLLSRPRPRVLLSVKVDGVVQTGLTTWDLYETGRIVRDTGSFTAGNRNVEVIYEHGFDEPDAELRQAAIDAIREKLLAGRSGIPARMTSIVTEMGTVLRTAAPRPTGIPEVDSVLQARSLVVGVG